MFVFPFAFDPEREQVPGAAFLRFLHSSYLPSPLHSYTFFQQQQGPFLFEQFSYRYSRTFFGYQLLIYSIAQFHDTWTLWWLGFLCVQSAVS